MNTQDRNTLFSELISRHQSELYAYIFSIVRNWEDADDLFQSVCLVLWEKFESFRPDSSFFAWARQTAKLTVRDFLRRKHMKRYATEELLDALSETAIVSKANESEYYVAALRRCKAKLTSSDEELIELRYVEDLGSRQIADRLQRPQRSVTNSLARIQRRLFDCLRREMARQEHAQKDGL